MKYPRICESVKGVTKHEEFKRLGSERLAKAACNTMGTEFLFSPFYESEPDLLLSIANVRIPVLLFKIAVLPIDHQREAGFTGSPEKLSHCS